MKKISIIVSTYPPYRGGMGNAAKRQANLLKQQGFGVEVVTPGVSDGEEIIDEVKVIRKKPLFRFGNASVINGINKMCANSDIVFLHYPFFGTAEFLQVRGRSSYRKGRKLVVYYHMDVVGNGLKKIIFKLHKQFLLPLIMKRADKILVSSQSYFESSFIKKYTEKVKVVPFSVAVPTNDLRDAREQKALFVGALDSAHYFKGVKNLLHAWLKVVEELPEAKLDIVGDGNLRGEYERYAKDLGLSDSVVFHGGVPALDKMYIEAKVTVLPSIDRSEAFGLVLLESMAEGTPIIASDLAGVNSVADSKYSQLVPPNNVKKLAEAIVESLKKTLTREDRIEIRRHIVDNYSDEVVAKLLADEMNNL